MNKISHLFIILSLPFFLFILYGYTEIYTRTDIYKYNVIRAVIKEIDPWIKINIPKFKNITPPPLKIKFVDLDTLKQIYMKDVDEETLKKPETIEYLKELKIYAVYVDNVVYFINTMKITNITYYEKAMVLHEYIHHYQTVYNKLYNVPKCISRDEAEAYRFHSDYLSKYNYILARSFLIDSYYYNESSIYYCGVSIQ